MQHRVPLHCYVFPQDFPLPLACHRRPHEETDWAQYKRIKRKATPQGNACAKCMMQMLQCYPNLTWDQVIVKKDWSARQQARMSEEKPANAIAATVNSLTSMDARIEYHFIRMT